MKSWFAFIAACLCLQLSALAATVSHTDWGKDAAGNSVELYTIKDAKAEVEIATYGARIVSIKVPNRKGEMGNVIVGRNSLQDYMTPAGAFPGATIGRFANRIDHGQFTLDGKTYPIPTGPNGIALHGGTAGFNTKTWTAKEIPNGVAMTLVSPDGDMGFPGTMTATVRFTLAEVHHDPALKIEYEATTDKPTIVNFTNHGYFNLADDSSTPVLSDIARIDADSYTPFDNRQIPTGEVAPVAGTPFDLRTAHAIGDKMPDRGYDHNFVLRAPSLKSPSVEVDDPSSGRTVQLFTTEPAIQFYVPHFTPPAPPAGTATAAPGGATPPRRPGIAAFTLETQHYPDSPNHPSFPSTELRPGKKFQSTTILVFGVKNKTAGDK